MLQASGPLSRTHATAAGGAPVIPATMVSKKGADTALSYPSLPALGS